MAFTQTTASSIEDVISQICAYAVANAGYTDCGMVTIGGNSVYSISKGSIYYSFRRDYVNPMYDILCRMSYSISGTAEPTKSNGQWDWTRTSLYGFQGPYPNLYIFTEGTCVHAVLELTTGVFTHISFGQITKTETFTGGEYISGMYQHARSGTPTLYNFNGPGSSPLFSGDGNTGTSFGGRSPTGGCIRDLAGGALNSSSADFCIIGGGNNNATGKAACGSTIGGLTEKIFQDAPNVATLRSIILPMYITLRDTVSGLKRFSGYVPNIRLVPMTYLDPGETILNDWQVFPFVAKESDGYNYPASGKWGLAYRKVP